MNTDRHGFVLRSAVLAAVLLVITSAASGQAPTAKPLAPNVVEHKFNSKLMGRDMPYRVILPAGYTDAKATSRHPVIYLLHGLTGHFNNWTDSTKVEEYALASKFIIVTPEGDNGWYTDSVTKATDKYESYIVKELIPEIEAKYRVIADRDNRMIAGLSMGGYGATKFGLKYPEMFSIIGAFSGALGAASFTEKNAATAGRGIDSIMGAEDAESRKANDIFKLVRELTPERIKALPFIYQSCGTEDFLIQNNREFMMLLVERKVPHEYRQHPGVHNWVFWDDQIREFLQVAERRMKK
ncbi:MAG: esterase family protein [Acidobacteria bacterium]|nr:esterase family protein [Acidobacteriota bacterium]MBP7473706.1 esterase family protein [Pyrinomonadaceae bacterium]MBP9108779.1 esterase family protein [Pyrinomonadaceae bacterium]